MVVCCVDIIVKQTACIFPFHPCQANCQHFLRFQFPYQANCLDFCISPMSSKLPTFCTFPCQPNCLHVGICPCQANCLHFNISHMSRKLPTLLRLPMARKLPTIICAFPCQANCLHFCVYPHQADCQQFSMFSEVPAECLQLFLVGYGKCQGPHFSRPS